jgi:hypothetical protein
MKDVVLFLNVITWRDGGQNIAARKRGCAADVRQAGSLRIDLRDVDRAGLKGKIAQDRHRCTGRAGRKSATAVDGQVGYGAGTSEDSARTDRDTACC